MVSVSTRTAGYLCLLLLPCSLSAQSRWKATRDAPASFPDSLYITLPAFGALGPDGNIWMFDAGNVLICDQRGIPISRLGRRGKGPGEFMNLRSFGFIKDTLWLYDEPTRRVTYVKLDHSVIRTEELPEFPTREGRTFSYVYIQGILTDRSLVAFLWGDVNRGVPWVRLAPFSSTPKQMQITEDFGLLKNDALVLKTHEMWFNPWRPSEGLWVSSDGKRFVTVTYEPGKGYHVAARSSSGPAGPKQSEQTAVLFSKDYNDPPVETPKAKFNGWIDDTLQRRGGPGFTGAERVAAVKEAVGDIKYLAPMTNVVLGNDGTTWIRRESLPRRMGARPDSVRWDVIDLHGTRVGYVYLPAIGRMIVVSEKRVWQTEEDENGEIHLMPYRISK